MFFALITILAANGCSYGGKSTDTSSSDCPEDLIGTWEAEMGLYSYFDVTEPASATKYCSLENAVFTMEVGGTSDDGHALGTFFATGDLTIYSGGTVYGYGSLADRFIGGKPLFIVLDESSFGSVDIEVYNSPPKSGDVTVATLDGDVAGTTLAIDRWSWDPTDNLSSTGDSYGCHGFYYGDRVTFTRTNETAPNGVTVWNTYASEDTEEAFTDCTPDPVDTGDSGFGGDTGASTTSVTSNMSDAEWVISLISDPPNGWPEGGHMSKEAMLGISLAWLNLSMAPDMLWSTIAHTNWETMFVRVPGFDTTMFETIVGTQLLAQPWFAGDGTVGTHLSNVKSLGHGMIDGLGQPGNLDVRDALDLLCAQFIENGVQQADVGLLEWQTMFLVTTYMPVVSSASPPPQ